MHKPSPHKELYDPHYHYTRGVLYFDEDHFTFTAYRVPYQDLDNRSWETEQAFTEDYRRLVLRKYTV